MHTPALEILMVGILFLSDFMIFGLVPIWMGITKCDVVKDEENAFFKMVKVQWWFLMKKMHKY